MRKKLFDFYKQAELLVQQIELDALSEPNAELRYRILKAVNRFNNLKNAVEDFIISNEPEQEMGEINEIH